jgi:hypothetical protein
MKKIVINLNIPLKKNLVIIIILNNIYCNTLNANVLQTSDTTWKDIYITSLAYYQQGRVLPTNAFVDGNNLRHLPINYYYAASIQLFRQTTGDKLWEQLYRYPRYGIGFYSVRFDDTRELGSPSAIYGVLDIPVIRWNNLSFNLDFGLGLTFNWESSGEDKYNIALGAEESTYIDAGPSVEYNFKNGLLLDIGASFTHFSNGDLKKPNYGINNFGTKISLGYNFFKTEKAFKQIEVPEFIKRSDVELMFLTGWENILYNGNDVDSATKNKGVYYPSIGFSATFNRQVSYKSKFGVGIMLGYMGAANSSIDVINGKLEDNDASFREGFELSIFPSYELIINRLTLLIQPGFYVYRAKYEGRTPTAYQRVGIKYDVYKDISIGINLRAYDYNVSDYIEWTLGYRLPVIRR